MAKQKGKGGAKKGKRVVDPPSKYCNANSKNDNSTDKANNGRKSRPRKNTHNNNNKWHQADEDDANFRNTLSNQGNAIKEMDADGNCLFRSLSDQLYDDTGAKHDTVRRDVCNFLSKNKEEFQYFLLMDDDDEDIVDVDEYTSKMREDGEWGGNVEIVVASRVYKRNIMVFSGEYSNGALSIVCDDKEKDDGDDDGGDLLLSYHGNDHYNSVLPMGGGGGGSRKQSAKPNKDNASSAKNDKKKGQTQQNGKNAQGKIDDTKQSTTETTRSRPPTRGSNCPCGSGLKYKKCCMAAEKSKKRLAKHLDKSGAGEGAADANADEEKEDEFIGDFKVLTI